MAEQEGYLTCPMHGEEHPRLVEAEDDDSMVECLRCDYVFQNVLKYPIVQVVNTATGEKYSKNALTGERK